MPSTFSNTGLELIADGEQAGTWGQTTNENLEMIEELASGVVSISLTGLTTYTLTTTNGASSNGRHSVVVFTGSPGATCTVTISPNDLQKVYFIDNQTDESLVFTQGSGGNATATAGAKIIVYCDGAGSGAKVTSVIDSRLSDIGQLTPAEDTWIVADYDNGTWTTTTGAGKLQTWAGKLSSTAEVNGIELLGSVTEDTYSLTGTTVNPDNGTIQYKTLTGDTTITLNMQDGQSVTFMVKATDPATEQTHEIVWGSEIDWKTEGGNQPTLNVDTYTVIVLWRLGSEYFGARVGDA